MLPLLMVMLMARGREDQETWDEFRLKSGLSDAEHSRFQQSYKRHCRRANLGDETTTQQKLAYITAWRRNSARNRGQQAPPQQQVPPQQAPPQQQAPEATFNHFSGNFYRFSGALLGTAALPPVRIRLVNPG